MRFSRREAYSYLIVLALWGIYAYESLTTPYNAERSLGLTEIQVRLLSLTIVLPYVVAWLAGLYASFALQSTVKSMPEKEDRMAYARIAQGILLLTVGLITTTMLGMVHDYLPKDVGAEALYTITMNYLLVFVPLAAFLLIHRGSGHLRRLSASADVPRSWMFLGGLFITAFAALYVWMIFSNPTRQAIGDAEATYYLHDAAIIATIVVPFIAMCGVAFLSLVRLGEYYRGVTGYVYKQAARNFMLGMFFVIFSNMFIQALLSLGSSRLRGLGLGALLGIIYAFIGTQTLGQIFVALGAQKLSTIERVMRKYETEQAKV